MSASTVPASAEPMSMDAIRALTYAGVEVDGITRRLVELSELKDGWFNGEGLAPDEEGLSWFNVRFHQYFPKNRLPDPGIFPTQDGGISCEWWIGRVSCDLELSLQRRTAIWSDLDRDSSDGIEEQVLDLDGPSDWAWLVERVNSLTQRASRHRKFFGGMSDAITQRLVSFSELQDGWMEGGSRAPTLPGLMWFRDALQQHYLPHDLPEVQLYPSWRGGVGCEWSLGPIECGLEVNLEERTGSWFDVHIDTEEGIDDKELRLDQDSGWSWIRTRLEALSEHAS